MEDDASDYSPPEQRLVDAIAAGALCDFGGDAAIAADEMASWGRERTIRATVLRQLLTAEDAQNAPNGVLLRGAVIKGILNIKGISAVQFDLQHCQIATIEASGAIFSGDASFNGAVFTGDARFDGATFTNYAWFNGATFTRDASFDGALRAHRLLQLPGVGQDAARLQARQPVDFDCQGTDAFWCRELNADVEPSQRATSG